MGSGRHAPWPLEASVRTEDSGGRVPADASGRTRRLAYGMLILVAVTIVGARILSAPLVFSANDLSRWATIRGLVETGGYAIGRRYQTGEGDRVDLGIMAEPGWQTIDVVMDPVSRRFYSSKPPLLPALLAGEYWLVRRTLGWTMRTDRDAIVRTILLTINWAPFVLYLIVFSRIADRLGTSDWGRLFAVTSASFGTFASGYLGSLNNHTVAAAAALFAVYHCLRIHLDDRRWWRFLLAGAFSGWAACNELPAAALATGVVIWLARLSWRDTLRWALPAMLLPAAASLYVQYDAVGSVVPTYALKGWYEFPGSYWLNPVGIDRAADPKTWYAFHLLAGHSGILSLTPMLVLGWIGMARHASAGFTRQRAFTPQGALAALTLGLTVVLLVFYVFRTNDYGGITVGPRWFIWMTPLWLLTMLPVADRWATHSRRRALAYVLLAISIGSAMFALTNPWRHSWLFVLLRDWGLISYQ